MCLSLFFQRLDLSPLTKQEKEMQISDINSLGEG